MLCSQYLTTKEVKELWINRLQSSRHLFPLSGSAAGVENAKDPKHVVPIQPYLSFIFFISGGSTHYRTHMEIRGQLWYLLSPATFICIGSRDQTQVTHTLKHICIEDTHSTVCFSPSKTACVFWKFMAEPGIVAHVSNFRTLEAEARQSTSSRPA